MLLSICTTLHNTLYTGCKRLTQRGYGDKSQKHNPESFSAMLSNQLFFVCINHFILKPSPRNVDLRRKNIIQFEAEYLVIKVLPGIIFREGLHSSIL